MDIIMRKYETVIGLEVHVELATESKIFCSCTTQFGGEANTHCCPVCTGMPGALPVLNRKVVEYAIAAGLALNCKIAGRCAFDRKNYYYPDLPKAYQISQLYLPLCRDGSVEIDTGKGKKTIRIHEIHMEEDAGKLVHEVSMEEDAGKLVYEVSMEEDASKLVLEVRREEDEDKLAYEVGKEDDVSKLVREVIKEENEGKLAYEISKEEDTGRLVHETGMEESTGKLDHEICMEENAGKQIRENHLHNRTERIDISLPKEYTLVDYNRCGVPLIEIVSEPDMSSADEVVAYLEKLRLILQYIGVSDCKMQEGSLRVDINLSVREVGFKSLGTRTEMKNLNSFKAIARAIEGEKKRQIELIEKGDKVTQETRRWDDGKNISYAMRSKEEAQDYRYFPEPDIPPIIISEEWLEVIRARQPELRDEKLARFIREYELPQYDALIITGSKHLADLFEEAVKLCAKPKEVSNWLMVEGMRLINEQELEVEDITFSPVNLSKLIGMVDKGNINRTIAKEVFEKIFKEDIDPESYIREHGLGIITDETILHSAIEKVMKDNAQSVNDYYNGKDKAIGYLIGQSMKELKGKADPGKVNSIIIEMLNK